MDCCDNNKIKTRAKLLVIDDDSQTHLIISDILEGSGINIIEMIRGTEALDFLKNCKDHIDLILLDIYLQGCDVWTLASKIRILNKKVPIIAIAAMYPKELAAKCRFEGFDGYFSKSFKMEKLKDIILSYFKN